MSNSQTKQMLLCPHVYFVIKSLANSLATLSKLCNVGSLSSALQYPSGYNGNDQRMGNTNLPEVYSIVLIPSFVSLFPLKEANNKQQN